MACEITIDPAFSPNSPNEGISTLTVTGTAEGCTSIKVRVHQTAPQTLTTPEKSVQVVNGTWSVDFTVADDDFKPGDFLCGRGNKYSIEAVCADDPDCNAQAEGDAISCGSCPEIELTVTPLPCENCRRPVELRAEVTSDADATFTWFFGADDDNQPGEDSQAGDGNGNLWLPPPNANGVRVVEVEHVYETPADQAETITVRFQTSTGPSSSCWAEKTFLLEPCSSDLSVTLEVSNASGDPVSTAQCLPAGNYVVRVSSPTGPGITYAWSVDGSSAGDGSDTHAFTIAAGQEATISVSVDQGACQGSNAVTARGCADCYGYDAQVRVVDEDGVDVTDDECLEPGTYVVEVVAPTGSDNTFRWLIDNEEDPSESGSSIEIDLDDDEVVLVTLEATRDECSDVASVVLTACEPEDEEDEDGGPGDEEEEEEEEEEENDGFIPCLLFKLLALLGLGFFFLGAVLVLCPIVAAPFPVQAAIGIGIGLVLGGLALLALGLTLWILICRPDGCDWSAFWWQALVLLGLVTIYAGFCPGCSWLLVGVLALILGAYLSIVWARNCDVSACGVLAEWISLFTFVVNVVAILEMVLAACVITTQPIAAFIWGAVIAGIQAWLWYRAVNGGCIRN